jgi:hypothetical protein
MAQCFHLAANRPLAYFLYVGPKLFIIMVADLDVYAFVSLFMCLMGCMGPVFLPIF